MDKLSVKIIELNPVDPMVMLCLGGVSHNGHMCLNADELRQLHQEIEAADAQLVAAGILDGVNYDPDERTITCDNTHTFDELPDPGVYELGLHISRQVKDSLQQEDGITRKWLTANRNNAIAWMDANLDFYPDWKEQVINAGSCAFDNAFRLWTATECLFYIVEAVEYFTGSGGPIDDPDESVRICWVCGCTEGNACIDAETGETCHWVDVDFCSACAKKAVESPNDLAVIRTDCGEMGEEMPASPFKPGEAGEYI
ncbi:MAG: hypothetical protein ACYC27_14745 [Armatimonadota bacterium]